MPNGNGKGPRGAGSMTGRGNGFCSGSSEPGCKNRNALTNKQEEQPTSVASVNSSCRGPLGCGTGRTRRGGRAGGE